MNFRALEVVAFDLGVPARRHTEIAKPISVARSRCHPAELLNRIRPISPANPKKAEYIEAGMKELEKERER